MCPPYTAEDAISIHALREEGDFLLLPAKEYDAVFLSTPSARRATLFRLRLQDR